jgi:hypothetical protein
MTKSGRRKNARPVVAAISQNSVALQGTQNRTPPTTPCRAALLLPSLERGSPRFQCGCVMLFDPWPRHEHHTVAHAHHRQPGRRRTRQTYPRRHALRTLGDGQQPDTPASLAARALSRDGVRACAHRAEVKQMCSALSAMDCDIITGGDPGLMQTANEGAQAAQASQHRYSGALAVRLGCESFRRASIRACDLFTRLHHFVLVSNA